MSHLGDVTSYEPYLDEVDYFGPVTDYRVRQIGFVKSLIWAESGQQWPIGSTTGF